MMNDQTAKRDEGKLEISLVPPQIIRDIAEVRMYGNKKYHDPENWRKVEKKRYVDALLRHLLEYIGDPDGVDAESGIPHYKHAACNMAFICEMEKKGETMENEKSIDELEKELEAAKKELLNCRNELCYMCGRYKESHLGACDDCRWKEVKG